MVPSAVVAAQILRESLKPLCPDAPCVALDFEEKTELKRVLARDTILLNGALEIEAKIQEELKTSSRKDDEGGQSAYCKSSVPPLSSSKEASKFRRKRILKQISKMGVGAVPTNIMIDAVGDMHISRRTVIHLRESRKVYPVYVRNGGDGSMFFLLFHPERLCWVVIHRCHRSEVWENLLVAYEESKLDCVNPVLTLGGRWKFSSKYSAADNLDDLSSGYHETSVGPIIGCRSEGKPVQVVEIPYLSTYQGDFAEKCGAEQHHDWLFPSTNDEGDNISLSFGTDRVLGTPAVKKDIHIFLQQETKRCLKCHKDNPKFRASSDHPCCLFFPFVMASYHQQYDMLKENFKGHPGCVNRLRATELAEVLTLLGDQYNAMVMRLEKGMHLQNPLQRKLADILLGNTEALDEDEEDGLPDSAFPFIDGNMPTAAGLYQRHIHRKDDSASVPLSENLASRVLMSDMLVPQEDGISTVRRLVRRPNFRNKKQTKEWKSQMHERMLNTRLKGVSFHNTGGRRYWSASASSTHGSRKKFGTWHSVQDLVALGDPEKNQFSSHRHAIEKAIRSRNRMLQVPGIVEQISTTGEDEIFCNVSKRDFSIFETDRIRGRTGKLIRSKKCTERQYTSLDGAFQAALAYRSWKTADDTQDRKPMDLLKDALAQHIVLGHMKIIENSKGLGDWLEVELDRREREEDEFAEKCSKNPGYEKLLRRQCRIQRRYAKRKRVDPRRHAIFLLKQKIRNRFDAERNKAQIHGHDYNEAEAYLQLQRDLAAIES